MLNKLVASIKKTDFENFKIPTTTNAIYGEQPGVGKSYVLAKEFAERFIENKSTGLADTILLTFTNSGKEEMLNKLKTIENGKYKDVNFSRKVSTMKNWKKNYHMLVENNHRSWYTVEMEEKFPQKPIDLFIDEICMIPKEEVEEILEKAPIRNLVFNGDPCQFDPIGGETVTRDSDGNVLTRTLLSQEVFKGNPDKTIVLTEPLRSVDSGLNKAARLIKAGDILGAMGYFNTRKEKEIVRNSTDWHIGYKNITCDKINQAYEAEEKIEKYVVIQNNKDLKLFKGEIYTLNDDGYLTRNGRVLPIRCMGYWWEFSKQPGQEYPVEFKDVKDHKVFADFLNYFKPSVAYTAYKLQGATLETGRIEVHLLDVLSLKDLRNTYRNRITHKECIAMLNEQIENRKEFCKKNKIPFHSKRIEHPEQIENWNKEFRKDCKNILKYGKEDLYLPKLTLEKAIKTFQKHLYVSVTRARTLDQIYIPEFYDIIERREKMISAIECKSKDGEDYSEYLKELEIIDMFLNPGPLEDDFGGNVVRCSARNCNCNFNYNNEDYREFCRWRVYNIKRKPRVRKYTDEVLLQISSLQELKKLTTSWVVAQRWIALHKEPTTKKTTFERVTKINAPKTNPNVELKKFQLRT